MMTINKIMENTKNAAPMATLPQGMKGCKSKPNDAGRSKIACARRDNAPATMRRVFLNESRDMIFNRIAQKRFFFYRAAIHDRWLYLRLLSTLKAFTDCRKPTGEDT
jgi:hypothetical protein